MIINTIKGKPEESKTVALDMASGNQVVTPDTGKVLSQVTVTKPATLVAGNIKNGVTIGGVTGTLSTGYDYPDGYAGSYISRTFIEVTANAN